jgi:archaellum component FlaC
MSNDEEFMRKIQDQFDKIVDSVPHKSKISEAEKIRQEEIKNRKADIKKELDELANTTKINEVDM